MKVVFKLTAAQLSVAAQIRKEVSASELTDVECYYAGNLIGDLPHHNSSNPSCDLSLHNDKITYEGDRHPLVVDGGLNVLKKITGGNIDQLEVVYYQTSERNLKWWETTLDFFERSTREELLGWFQRHEKLTPLQALVVARQAKGLGMKPILPGTTEYRKYAAQGDNFSIVMSRKMYKALEGNVLMREVQEYLEEVAQ